MDGEAIGSSSSVERILGLLHDKDKHESDANYENELYGEILRLLLRTEKHWWCRKELAEIVQASMIFFSLEEEESIVEFKSIMNEQLSTCKECLENFYEGLEVTRQAYSKEYDEENVKAYFDSLDDWISTRVKAGLKEVQGADRQPDTPHNAATAHAPVIASPRTLAALYETLLHPTLMDNLEVNRQFTSAIKRIKHQVGPQITFTARTAKAMGLLFISEDKDARSWSVMQLHSFASADKKIDPTISKAMTSVIKQILSVIRNATLHQEFVKFKDEKIRILRVSEVPEYWRALRRILRVMDAPAIEWLWETFPDVVDVVYRRLADTSLIFEEALNIFAIFLKHSRGALFNQISDYRDAEGETFIQKLVDRIVKNPQFRNLNMEIERNISQIQLRLHSHDQSGEGSNEMIEKAEKLADRQKALINCLMAFHSGTGDDEYSIGITTHVIKHLLGTMQDDQWPVLCQMTSTSKGINLIYACYELEEAAIPYDAINEVAGFIVGMLSRKPSGGASTYVSEVATKVMNFIQYVLADEVDVLRSTYIAIHMDEQAQISETAQFDICHKLWYHLCQEAFSDAWDTNSRQYRVLSDVLSQYSRLALLQIPAQRQSDHPSIRERVSNFLAQALTVIVENVRVVLRRVSHWSPASAEALLKTRPTVKALIPLLASPTPDIREAASGVMGVTFGQKQKSLAIRQLILNFPGDSLDGACLMLEDYIELTQSNCDTFAETSHVFSVIKECFETFTRVGLPKATGKELVEVVDIVGSTMPRVSRFWDSAWRAMTCALDAAVQWSETVSQSRVVEIVLQVTELANSFAKQSTTFQGHLDASDVKAEQERPSLPMEAIIGMIQPLSIWIQVNSEDVLRRVISLLCRSLELTALQGLNIPKDMHDAFMELAQGKASSLLTSYEKRELFVALSAHHPQLNGTISAENADPSSSTSSTSSTSKHIKLDPKKSSRQATLMEMLQPSEPISVEDDDPQKKAGSTAEPVIIGDEELTEDFSEVFIDIPDEIINELEFTLIKDVPVEKIPSLPSMNWHTRKSQATSERQHRYEHLAQNKNQLLPKRHLPFGRTQFNAPKAASGKPGSRLSSLRSEFKSEGRSKAESIKAGQAAVRRRLLETKINGATTNGQRRSKTDTHTRATDSESSDSEGEKGGSGLAELAGQPKAPPVHLLKGQNTQKDRAKPRLIPTPGKENLLARAEQMRIEEQNQIRRRMRLLPRLTGLHKSILSWNILSDSDIPPTLTDGSFATVPDKFEDALEYTQILEPLLLLEAWQQLLRGKQEANESDVIDGCVVDSRCNVDDFTDVNMRLPLLAAKSLGVDDLIFVANHFGPEFFQGVAKGGKTTWKGLGFLAKVSAQQFRKDIAEITARCYFEPHQIRVLNSIGPKTTWKVLKIASLITVNREYSALKSMEYFELADHIMRPEPQRKPPISENAIERCMQTYDVNEPQAEAILGASERKLGFTLIQGPPGTGKTKTILGLISNLLHEAPDNAITVRGERVQSNRNAQRKLLVCAPSNAAVDEIVKRLKAGILAPSGIFRPTVVRIGTGESVNVAVRDLTLEALVEEELQTMSVSKEGNNSASNVNRERLLEDLRKVKQSLEDCDKQIAQSENDPVKRQTSLDRKRALRARKTEIQISLDSEREQRDARAKGYEATKIKVRDQILSGAHVVCCTLSGSGNEIIGQAGLSFDTVIIDEAAQSIEISSLIPLKYECKRCILVGDPNQLPPTVLSLMAAKYSYEQSLFVRLQRSMPDAVYLLSIQYRMHPSISQFPSKLFYEGQLVDGEGMDVIASAPWHRDDSPLFQPYTFIDIVDGREEVGFGQSIYNSVEADAAVALLDFIASQNPTVKFAGTVGVITPYSQQLRELKRRFEKRFGREILSAVDFNTIDGFQGQEKDIIIFSCVRAANSKGIGFLADIRRMNVGLTRARCSLYVLGNAASLKRSPYWGKLVEDSQERSFLVQCRKPYFGDTSQGQNIPTNIFARDVSKIFTPTKTSSKVTSSTQKHLSASKYNHSSGGQSISLKRKDVAIGDILPLDTADNDVTTSDVGKPMPLGITANPPTQKLSLQDYKDHRNRRKAADSNASTALYIKQGIKRQKVENGSEGVGSQGLSVRERLKGETDAQQAYLRIQRTTGVKIPTPSNASAPKSSKSFDQVLKTIQGRKK